MITVAAPLRVRERLLAAPDGPRTVLHAGPAALYVDLDGWCLGLVAATATRVPCALWSSLPDIRDLARGPVRVEGGTFVISGQAVRITRLVDVTVPAPGRHENLRFAPAISMTSAQAVDLVGRGPGLTPLGDDVLAGWFAARHAAGRPDEALADVVRRHLGATTLLSATLLDCAMRGETLPQLAAWLADPTPVARQALEAIGATSGTGLLAGAELALASLATDHRPGRAA